MVPVDAKQGSPGRFPWIVASLLGKLYTGDNTLTEVKWDDINATANGDNTILQGVPGKKIRIIAITIESEQVVSVAFKSGASNTIIQAMSMDKHTILDVNRQPAGWFMETNVGEAFVLNLSSAVNVRGSYNYVEVSP